MLLTDMKIFKSDFLSELCRNVRFVKESVLDSIVERNLNFEDEDLLKVESLPDFSNIELEPTSSKPFSLQFDNAIKFYESARLSPYAASDARLWSFLALGSFRDYMQVLRPLPGDTESPSDLSRYILSHYLFSNVSVRSLLLHDIALLWWIPHLTVREDLGDKKYVLTEEVFSMADYTRHLLISVQGRVPQVRYGLLRFASEQAPLFAAKKAEKIRFIMRRLNAKAGLQLIGMLSEDDILGVVSEIAQEDEFKSFQ
jgi:hypothetical protein